MQPFDLQNAPLKGINLIEASAGTGKTYNIEGLLIRLILEMQLTVDQILVLTFTNAATEELRQRIRNKLVQVEDAFTRGTSDDALIESLLEKSADTRSAARRIHAALIDFDKAAIFTIHGFCQRVLAENAFEARNLFDTELVADQAYLVQEVADDYWRKTFYPAPAELISFAAASVKGPDYFYRLLNRVKTLDVKIVPDMAEPALDALRPYREALNVLKAEWPVSRAKVIRALMDPVLNATIYGSLKPGSVSPGATKRELKVGALAEAMDHFADPKSVGFPFFDGFENFTAAKIARATKKQQTPPEHYFFTLCDELCRHGDRLNVEMEQYLLFIKTRLFAYAASELRKRKADQNIQYFDDLLTAVKKALDAEGGTLLASAIRQKYKAALVDEFQDTDSIQYDILTRLFARKDGLLFMIGDPKQAIYGFRGADIFSYLKAARGADSKFTLTQNWRSQPKLITAVNTLFSGVDAPFVFDEIPFEKGRAAAASQNHAETTEAPFILWYLDSRRFAADQKPVTKTEAVQLIANAVAEEICRLISGAAPVEAGEIAVLVRTNNQARMLKEILTTRQVPSVLYGADNLFDTHEALEIEKILTGIADPASLSRLKAAFATEIMGIRAEDLISDDLQTPWWQTRLVRVREYHQLWNRHGFIRMFRMLLAAEQVPERLLGFPNGERRLTNVLHLAEVLHRQSMEKKTGMTGLLKWLIAQRDPYSPRLEAHQLRLESDEKAVKIVTIHKSKGLEYPVVFCPFGWESSLISGQEFTFHDTENEGRLTFDLDGEANAGNIAAAQNELLSENLRLLYVALTRAKKRCYLAWGRIRTAETSALTYLLHSGADAKDLSPADDRPLLLKRRFESSTDEQLLEDLNQLARRSQNCIRIEPLPAPSDSNPLPASEKEERLFCLRFDGRIDPSWKIASYSSLVSRGAADIDRPDRDRETLREPLPRDSVVPPGGSDIFSFPTGTRSGNFFHSVFEQLDFQQTDPGSLEALIAARLAEHGLAGKWLHTVYRAVRNVLSIPLRSRKTELKLSSIPASDRVNEMEFYVPLKPVTSRRLRKIFADHRGPGMSEDVSEQLEKLALLPSQGFMKGYVDMVFGHQGAFYVVDWKSNHLGSTHAHYDPPSLLKTMRENDYILQYHIYVLAVHQLLRLRIPGYRYEKDFGGVFYIFIRGIDPGRGPEYGVYFDLPAPGLIHALEDALVPGGSPEP